jgi:hypothetical protein
VLERGPETRTQTVVLFDKDVPTRRLLEINRIGGVVSGGDGAPVHNAWVVMSGVGFAVSDKDGRFIFSGMEPGDYTCMARGPDGAEAEVKLTVPGGRIDLTLGSPTPKKRPKTGGSKA